MDRFDSTFRMIFVPVVLVSICLTLVSGSACNVVQYTEPTPEPGETGDSAEDLIDDLSSNGSLIPPQKYITVQFINSTPLAIETMFYVSTDILEDPSTELFTDQYLYKDGVGLASSGILDPDTEDTIELACDDVLLVGTKEAVVRDPDLGTALGTGPTRLYELGVQFDCGAAITFEYKVENGAFEVHASLD